MSEPLVTLRNTLCQRQGKTFLYKTREHKINNFRITEDKCYISTSIDLIVLDYSEAEKIIRSEFLPVDAIEIVAVGESMTLKKLKESNIIATLQENIEKLKLSKEFINQAKAINGTVNTMLNIVRTEILFKKNGK
jgi:hypothetical protein